MKLFYTEGDNCYVKVMLPTLTDCGCLWPSGNQTKPSLFLIMFCFVSVVGILELRHIFQLKKMHFEPSEFVLNKQMCRMLLCPYCLIDHSRAVLVYFRLLESTVIFAAPLCFPLLKRCWVYGIEAAMILSK